MLKISLVAALALGGLLACATVASAQDANANKGKGRGQNVTQRVDALATELTLTAEQKTKVTALFEEQGKKMQAMRTENANLTQEQRREKMTALRDEQNKKMKEILTPAQFEKYTKMQAEMRKRAPGGKKAE